MNVEIKHKKSKLGGPLEAQEVLLEDKIIESIFQESGPRKDIKIKGADYLSGLYLRYSPKTQSKVFYLKYKHNGKMRWYRLNDFIKGTYGSTQVTKDIIELRQKYYINGKWQYDPNDELITLKELQGKQNYKVRDVIKRIIEDSFPRITKVGRLDFKTQKVYTRFYLGYHNRLNELDIKTDDNEFGVIKLKTLETFDDYWETYPQDKKGKSIFDSYLGSAFIKDIDRGILELYVLKTEKSWGQRDNLRKALQYLFNYADTHLKAFGSKGLLINPTNKIRIPKTDEIKYKGSKYNDFGFSKDQRLEVERSLNKVSATYPFASESILITGISRIRHTEACKLKKEDIKEDHILLRKEIQKDRSKGRKKDIQIWFTPEIISLLEKLHKQYERYPTTKFSPWLFPNIQIPFVEDKPGHPRLDPEDYIMRKTWNAVKKDLKFEGAIKTLRKTFITKRVETFRDLGLTQEEAISATAEETHNSKSNMVRARYYKPDLTQVKKTAKELGQVLSFKIKT